MSVVSHPDPCLPACVCCNLVSSLTRQDIQSEDPSVSAPAPAHQEGPTDSGQDTKDSAQNEPPSVPQEQDTHPAERKYSPIVTCRYPETDWEDAEPFPLHLPMFCFPGELSFKIQEDQPATTYHSFVMTQETGYRSYAMCVTLYERMPKPMHRQFEALCRKWTKNHMTEDEMEYARAIQTKISRERTLLRSLRDSLREERTLGRNANVQDLKREIMEAEEKLSLLEDQMQPWRKLYVDSQDVWVPRCIGLVSSIPYHYLLRDWLLAVVVACSGGVDHPGMSMRSMRLESYVKNILYDVGVPPFGKQEIGITINDRIIYASRPALNSVPIVKNFSLFPLFRCISPEDVVTIIEVMLSEGKVLFVSSHLGMLTLASESILYLFFPLYWHGVYIPILPAALMTCLQAPVPYIIGIERSCCDSDFPPEDACVVDLDNGTVKVQRAPLPLPPRPRRKLIQSLEQCAPFSISRRSTTGSERDESFGPPKYIQEAYPNSRLTLFCGISRAPRKGNRADSLRPPAPSTLSTITSGSSIQESSPAVSRRASTATLPRMNSNALPKIPKVDFEKETLTEGFKDQEAAEEVPLERTHSRSGSTDEKSLPPIPEPKEWKTNKVAPDQGPLDMASPAMRKVMAPQRARANLYEFPKSQENSSQEHLARLPYQNQSQSLSQGHLQNLQSHPSNSAIYRSNSSQSTLLTTSDGASRKLTHRSSLTSMESSSSSTLPKSTPTSIVGEVASSGSPLSTMTGNTMESINGSSINSLYPEYGSSSTSSLSQPPQSMEQGINGNRSGVIFVEEEAEEEPDPTMSISREGHVLVSVTGQTPITMMNSRCGVCSHSLVVHQQVHKCEGCPILVHAGCIDDLMYPCVPRGFDESGVCWSVLQMWAGLLKSYRSGILAGYSFHQHQLQIQQLQMQLQMYSQHQNPRVHGHAKQLSSSGSESEKEAKDRFSWASIRGWTSRSNSTTPSARNTGVFTTLDGAQTPQQPPITRSRRGTNGSVASDTVRFHRDVFMKSVDKDAKSFMTVFVETQAFVQFVQDRIDRSPGDPEIMFFDEVIKAKVNRSRFRIGKEETKFLDDPNYGIQSTCKAAAPSGEEFDYDTEARRFPTKLDPAYFASEEAEHHFSI
ncbi:MAG: AEX-3 domain-containing protein [Benniella sp.]|nr:MAG: AEX-3 domain-containing protein [Benniella sp.]